MMKKLKEIYFFIIIFILEIFKWFIYKLNQNWKPYKLADNENKLINNTLSIIMEKLFHVIIYDHGINFNNLQRNWLYFSLSS